MLHLAWPSRCTTAAQRPAEPIKSQRKRSKEPKPFAGLTLLQWLVEAADQVWAFSLHILHDVRVRHVQLDELFALLSAVKDREGREAEAIEHLERFPPVGMSGDGPREQVALHDRGPGGN